MRLHTSCVACRQLVILDQPPRDPPTCSLTCNRTDGALAEQEAAFLEAVMAGDPSAADAAAARLDSLATAAEAVSALVAAKTYVARGWPVFPVAPGGKVPAIPKSQGGNGVLDATTDLDRIERYWTKNPKANIGVATGHMFDAIDVDFRVPGSAIRWADIRDGDIEVDALVFTPGGLHAYVLPTGDGNSANPDIGIDFRGKGGYVVAPPSVRPDGNYKWWSKPSPRILKP